MGRSRTPTSTCGRCMVGREAHHVCCRTVHGRRAMSLHVRVGNHAATDARQDGTHQGRRGIGLGVVRTARSIPTRSLAEAGVGRIG